VCVRACLCARACVTFMQWCI